MIVSRPRKHRVVPLGLAVCGAIGCNPGPAMRAGASTGNGSTGAGLGTSGSADSGGKPPDAGQVATVALIQQWNNGGTLYLLPYLASDGALTPTAWVDTQQGFASAANGTPGLLSLNLDKSPTDSSGFALVQQWNNQGSLWLLPYAFRSGTLTPLGWTQTGQPFDTSDQPSNPTGLLALDLSGDGNSDLVQQWNNDGGLWLMPYVSDGVSGFAEGAWLDTRQPYPTAADGTPGLVVVDLNGDGKADLLQQWNNDGGLWLLPYLSDGATFVAGSWLNTGQAYASSANGQPGLLALDLNGDGRTDLVQQWNNAGTLYLLPYLVDGKSLTPTAWFNSEQGYAAAQAGPGLLAMDLDGDGKTDLVQQWNNGGKLWLLPYLCTGTSFSETGWFDTGQGFASGPNATPASCLRGIHHRVAAGLRGGLKRQLE